MQLPELRTLAIKMARKRGWGEDAEQEALIAAWRASAKSDNPHYIAKSITNRLNQLYRDDSKQPDTQSYDVFDFTSQSLAVDDWVGLHLDWAVRVLRDRVDSDIVLGIAGGMSLAEVSRTWGLKRWTSYLKPALHKAWRESNAVH